MRLRCFLFLGFWNLSEGGVKKARSSRAALLAPFQACLQRPSSLPRDRPAGTAACPYSMVDTLSANSAGYCALRKGLVGNRR